MACNHSEDKRNKLCEFIEKAVAMDEFKVECRDGSSIVLMPRCPNQNCCASCCNLRQIDSGKVELDKIDPDNKELLLRRIRRAVLASISPGEDYRSMDGKENKLKIEYGGNRIDVPDPLTIEITDGKAESKTTHKIHFLTTYPVVSKPEGVQNGEAAHVAGKSNFDIIFKIFDKKIEILMEEYRSLRAEILQRQSALNTIMNFSIPALGLALTASYNVYQAGPKSLAGVILIAVFLVTSTMNKLWLNEASSIGRIGYFLARIEVEINQFFGRFQDENNERLVQKYDLDIDYETTLRRIRRHYELKDRFSLGPEPGRVTRFFMLSEIITTLLGVGILYREKDAIINFLGIITSVVLLILLCTVWLFVYIKSVTTRLRKVGYVEQWHKALISTDPILHIQLKKEQPSRTSIR